MEQPLVTPTGTDEWGVEERFNVHYQFYQDELYYWDVETQQWYLYSSGGGGGGSVRREQQFEATQGQTDFVVTVASLPLNTSSVLVFRNGVLVERSIAGNTITVQALDSNDILYVNF